MGVPSRNDEYFFYQTLIGAYPFEDGDREEFRGRIREYTIKAIREAKVYTGWITQDTEYEGAYMAFIDAVLQPTGDNLFLKDFLSFQRKIAHYGILNSLAQTLIKITAPGVPDFYQGTELWELSLVDPDNRRPVDYGKRRSLLNGIIREDVSWNLLKELHSAPQEGNLKLFLIYRALKARKHERELFEKGSYMPLKAEGDLQEHLIAFARQWRDSFAITIVPRFLTDLVKEGEYPVGQEIWGNTLVILPGSAPFRWTDALTGQEVTGERAIPVGMALKLFPVSLLLSS